MQSPNRGREKNVKDKEERERDQIKFTDLRFERWQVVRFKKARRKQEESKTFHKLHVLGINDDL